MSERLRRIQIGISVLGLLGCSAHLAPPISKTAEEVGDDIFECRKAEKLVQEHPGQMLFGFLNNFSYGFALGRYKAEKAALKNNCLKSRGWTEGNEMR
jgi:hypothetical protein